MVKANQTIVCWMTDGGCFDDGTLKVLNRYGFDVQVVVVPSEKDFSNWEQWLISNFPSNAKAVLWSGDTENKAPQFLRALRNIEEPPLQFLPVIALYQNREVGYASRFVEWGFDDFVCWQGNIEEVAARLELRIAQSQLSTELHLENISRIRKEAETETAIKQREEFLGICAHDLRSPLGLITSSLSMVLSSEESGSLSKMSVELMTRARRQADHAIALVNDLLDVMSYEQGLKPEYELFDLDKFLTDFYNDYRLQAEERNITFHYENRVSGWKVLADTDRIRQLLQNLFANAVKFTDPGKAISLLVNSFTGRRRTDPPYPMVTISIKDEGKGIPEEEIRKIFDRFSQLKDYSRPQGRGLGLSVAKQISKHHGGNVWVESEQGKGSTFHVLLPHVISEPNKDRKPGKSVLIATSDKKRKELFTGFKSWGYECLDAKDGLEAIALSFFELPDVIFLTGGLTKVREHLVANYLKADPRTRNIPLIMAIDRRDSLPTSVENILIDELAKVPFHSKEDFLTILEKIHLKKQTIQKKAS